MEVAVLPPEFQFLHDEHSLLETHGDQFLCLKIMALGQHRLLVYICEETRFLSPQTQATTLLHPTSEHTEYQKLLFLPTLSDVGL